MAVAFPDESSMSNFSSSTSSSTSSSSSISSSSSPAGVAFGAFVSPSGILTVAFGVESAFLLLVLVFFVFRLPSGPSSTTTNDFCLSRSFHFRVREIDLNQSDD